MKNMFINIIFMIINYHNINDSVLLKLCSELDRHLDLLKCFGGSNQRNEFIHAQQK